MQALEVDPVRRSQSAAQMAFDLATPRHVRLTGRAFRLRQDSLWTVFGRWRVVRRIKRFTAPTSVAAQLASVPVICAAVDLSPEGEALAVVLRGAVKRLPVTQPEARVACVNVIKTALIGVDQATDAAGNNLHVQRLVALRAWAREIDLPEDRLTFTVLEGVDPGQAIISHATASHVCHILMGACGHSTTRRYLGSVFCAGGGGSGLFGDGDPGAGAALTPRLSPGLADDQNMPCTLRAPSLTSSPTPAMVLQALSAARVIAKKTSFFMCLPQSLAVIPDTTRCRVGSRSNRHTAAGDQGSAAICDAPDARRRNTRSG